MKILLMTLVSLAASLALAKPYGDAGCGLGSMIFAQKNEPTSQVLAATTNGTSGNQTFGISSGTSNCTDSGHVKEAMQVPMYIEINKLSLAKDAARGQGDTVSGLAQLLGCNAKNLGPAMQSHYKQIFVDTNMQPAAIEAGIHHIMTTNKAHACGMNNVAAQ
jgi:hypothetical protein